MSLLTRSSSAVVVAALLVPRIALAESAADLIKNGKDLVEKGSVDQGCALIFRAESLEPTVDSIGLVAACHEKQGKLASAYREYLTTADRAAKANDERQKFALDQAAKLEPRVPHLTVKPAAGEAPKLSVGGEDYSTPKMVDPGTVTVIATDPQGKSWKKDVTVVAGESPVVDVPPMSTWAGGASLTPTNGTAETHYAPGPPVSAIVAGSVGLAGLGVMAGGGIAAIVLNNQIKSVTVTTNGKTTCTVNDAKQCADAKSKHDSSASAAIAADVGLGVGVAGVALAAIFWGAHVGAKTIASDEKHATLPPVDVVPLTGGGAVVWRGTF